MRSSRLVVAAALIAVIVVLVGMWPGSQVQPSDQLEAVPVPAVREGSDATSTWFCTAGSAPTDPAADHFVLVVSPSGTAGPVTLSGFGIDGPVGETTLDIDGVDQRVFDVGSVIGEGDLSVMVESSIPDLVIEHRLSSTHGFTQVPCATNSSDEWFFPSQTTVRGASAQLELFNPFPKDASVDITMAGQDRVIVPPALSGLVVPAGTKRVVDLGEHGQRQPLLSVSVRLRTGRVVAETVEVLDTEADEATSTVAKRGVRLQLGVRSAQRQWVFAGGFSGEGAQEDIVLYNPGDDVATVLVQVVPYGGAELAPEPFEVDVAPRRHASIDMTAESRVPPTGFHAIEVRSDSDIVVGRVNDLTGPAPTASTAAAPQRPDLDRGTSIGTGSSGLASRWVTSGFYAGDDQQSSILIHNPGGGIARVTVRVLREDSDDVLLADGLELAAGDSAAVQAAGAGLADGQYGVVIESDQPVVVEALVPQVSQDDFSLGLAIPVLRPGTSLDPFE